MAQFTDAYIYENRPQRLSYGYSILAGGFASSNPKVHMQLLTLDYVANELHNTFVEKSLRLHNIRVVLFGINEIPYKKYGEKLDAEFFEFEKCGNSYVVLFRGGFLTDNPEFFLDEKIQNYLNTHKGYKTCHQFVESHLDMPQIRVLVFNIDDFDYSVYKNNNER